MKKKESRLSDLLPGQEAYVKELLLTGNMKRRMEDLGMIAGTQVKCVAKNPSGDPKAFWFRGTVMAIRKEHSRQILTREEKGRKRVVALAGNPNVGKSTVFNSLTGLHQHTGNWPGKTVENARGWFRTARWDYELVDLPGTYSLVPQSTEEEIAGEFLGSGKADAVVVVCDATCLERNLNLVFQIMERTSDVVLCLNLMDEAKRKRIWIHQEKLAKRLGIPVVGVSAHEKKSLEKLKQALDQVMEGNLRPKPILPDWEAMRREMRKEPLRQTLQEGDSKRTGMREGDSKRAGTYEEGARQAELYIRYAEEVCRETVVLGRAHPDRPDRMLDRCFTSRLLGYPMMLFFLMMIFWLTIAGANVPSQLLSSCLFRVQDWLTGVFAGIGAPDWLHGLLVLGMYRVVAWVVSVMLPPMAIFFPLFTLLEEAGYLPRIAFNLDHCFQKCKACGKQALTMAMGFGCNAVGVMGCRIIDSPRERLIALLTNSLVPCNGRFPTLITMLSLFFIGTTAGFWRSVEGALLLTLFISLGVFMTFFSSKLLSHTLLKGTPSGFLLELPPYRRPRVGQVIWRSVLDRTLFVLGRAIVVAAPAGMLIWLLANVTAGGDTLLNHCTSFLDPFARLLGLDGVILASFLLGIPANEIVLPIMLMAYLQQGQLVELSGFADLKGLLLAQGWTPITACCVMVFSLMHWPCSTTLLTIKRETGSVRWMAVAFLLPTLLGMTCCALIHGAALLAAM